MALTTVILRGKDNRVLLQLRDNIPNILFPDQWGLFGGHTEPGETPLEGAIREIKEELEINLTEKDLNLFLKTKIIDKDLFVFVAPYNLSEEKIVFYEGSDAKFFSKDEIKNIKIIPEIKKVLEKYWKKFK